MPELPPPDIFISYAREDRALAQSLAAVCERQGWRVWWDRMTPDGGVYDEVIAANLASARVVVVFWTADAVASHFVRDEAGRARDRGKLVPVRIAGTEIPLGFGQFQTRDLGNWSGDPDDPVLTELIAQIGKRLGQEATPIAPRRWWKRIPDLQRKAVVASIVALVLAAAGTVWLVNREDHQHAFELTLQGLDAKNAKQYDKAVQFFTEAIRADKRYGSPWVERGMLYASRGEVQLARADLTSALQLKLDTTSHQRTEILLRLLDESATAAPGPVATADATAPVAAAPPPPPVQAPIAATSPAQKESKSATAVESAPRAETELPTAQIIGALSGVLHGLNHSKVSRHPPAKPAASKPVAAPAPQPVAVPDTPLGHSVRDLFAETRDVRIAATSKLISTPGWQAQAVPLTVAAAMADLDNKNGVINALIYLQAADPAVLQQHADAVQRLIDRAQAGGPQTAEAASKLRTVLTQNAPRVFIHIDDENQRALAQTLDRKLRDKGYAVQGIENIAGKATAPAISEVRVQGPSRPEGAQAIANEMNTLAAAPRLVSLPAVRAERDTYEVWLAKGLCSGGEAPRACVR